LGAARILHLNRNGKFLGQWYGNQIGPGKFSMAHGIAVDPKNGDVWIGDREEYRSWFTQATANSRRPSRCAT
jgi:hypothetical protein